MLRSYSTDYVTVRGRLIVQPGDPRTLRIAGILQRRVFDKYSRIARPRFEGAYAAALKQTVDRWAANVVVLCNVPLFAQRSLARHLRRSGGYI